MGPKYLHLKSYFGIKHHDKLVFLSIQNEVKRIISNNSILLYILLSSKYRGWRQVILSELVLVFYQRNFVTHLTSEISGDWYICHLYLHRPAPKIGQGGRGVLLMIQDEGDGGGGYIGKISYNYQDTLAPTTRRGSLSPPHKE